MSDSFLFTSESVTEGHPDKMADQISDAILDALLKDDPNSRVGCETMITTGVVIIAGEISSHANIDFQEIVRNKIKEIGYDDSAKGFDANTCSVMVCLDKQSPDIAQGVNYNQGLYKEQGAGDQGLMFGYAVDETPELMPMPIALSHRLTSKMSELRKNSSIPYLRPDGKSQVTIRYEKGKPMAVTNVVLSSQHDEQVTHKQIRQDLIEQIGKEIIDEKLLEKNTTWHINPTGKFIIGGPMGDCGLTGRKIIVDTYGGMGRHGGGCFSGKDPSKVDRSATYAARYIAKNIVASGVAKECEVQLAYAIGYSKPVSINVNTFGTALVDENRLIDFVHDTFPLTPKWIIEHFNLLRPIYQATAAYGHFGRSNPDFTWEKTDFAQKIKESFS